MEQCRSSVVVRQRLTASDDLTCFRCPPKFGITAAETEMLPKVSRLLSAETGSMPKVLKSTFSAPKTKPKPKFGRTLLLAQYYPCACNTAATKSEVARS